MVGGVVSLTATDKNRWRIFVALNIGLVGLSNVRALLTTRWDGILWIAGLMVGQANLGILDAALEFF
jgi:hypothetical protein